MFVREEFRLDAAFPAARARLADLANGGSLLTAAQAATGDEAAHLARVGPLGPVRGLSRVVQVQFRDLVAHGDSAQLALRWEAVGAGGSLFPALDADITLSPVDSQASMLTLTGVYRPPLGSVGAGLDQALLHRLAAATIRDFLGRVRDAIVSPAVPAGTPPDIGPHAVPPASG